MIDIQRLQEHQFDAMGRRSALALLAGVAMTTLGGCSSAPRRNFIRLTLDVETPEGLRTGSSVVERVIGFNDGLLKGLGNAVNTAIRGKATVVDLGARGLLFCIFVQDWTREKGTLDVGDLAMQVFNTDGSPGFYDGLNARRPQGDVPLLQLPLLVRFRDVGDPRTVEVVHPDDLAASFGPGVRLVRATIAITDGPITTGIERRMPTYVGRDDWYRWRSSLPYGDPLSHIGPESFSRGL